MKVLIMDTIGGGDGVDLALRAQEAGHVIRYWLPRKADKRQSFGQGLLARPDDWKPSMDWADLIILTGNSDSPQDHIEASRAALVPYFGDGYPIFGTNPKAAEIELDRGRGQEVLEEFGVDTLPYYIVSSAEEAVGIIKKEGKPFVMKPWGGDCDKSMTCVPKTMDEAIFTLDKWKKDGKFKGQLMLQKKVDGIEMGISGWFGPGGWSTVMEESFEHKKFMNDDVGENTGEMGTVIRHVTKSKLFDLILEPLTDYLHRINYVGDCSVNCIIEGDKPWPLEFTMRLGWPDFCIRQSVITCDLIEWMYDLVHGKDTLRCSTGIATGVLMTHGDFPKSKDLASVWTGYPIYGITSENQPSLHFQEVMDGEGPREGEYEGMVVTAGNYVMVVTGVGKTVTSSAAAAYKVVKEISWPSNVMYRTDIGKRLEKELPILQKNGYALGMRY